MWQGAAGPGGVCAGLTRTPLPAAEKLLRWAGAKEAVGDFAPCGGRRGWHRRPRLPGSPRPPLQLLQKWAPQLSPSRSTCPPGARTPPPRPTPPQLRQHHPSPTTCTCPPMPCPRAAPFNVPSSQSPLWTRGLDHSPPRGRPGHRTVLSSTAGLHPPDASGAHPGCLQTLQAVLWGTGTVAAIETGCDKAQPPCCDGEGRPRHCCTHSGQCWTPCSSQPCPTPGWRC